MESMTGVAFSRALNPTPTQDRLVMPDAWKSVKIREFEHVPVTTSVALLRITGKPPRRYSPSADRPVLLADDGQQVRRFVALPSPPDDRGVVRAAYSVTADLVATGTIFSLELSDGSTIALPAPTPGAARPLYDRAPDASTEATDAPETVEVDEHEEPGDAPDEDRRAELAGKLTELSARLAESEQARTELEAAAADADVHAQRQSTSETTSLRDQVHALESRLALAEERASESVEEMTAARHRADELEQIHADLETAIEEQRENIQRLEGDVAEAVLARDDIEQNTVGPLQAARDQAEQELSETRETIATMTIEHQELETWRGELERRLTESIDELSETRAGREEDEAQLGSLRQSQERDQAELTRVAGELLEAEANVELLQSEVASLNERLTEATEATQAAEAARDAALAQVAEASNAAAALEAAGSYSPTEREALALQAEQLVTLLSSTELLTELARDLSDARTQAESLHAAAAATRSAAATPTAEPAEPEPAPALEEPAEPETPEPAPLDEPAEPDESAHEAIEELRAQLAHARGAETDDRIEAIAHSAESEARDLAERELAEALSADH
jgi:hypothetical protein